MPWLADWHYLEAHPDFNKTFDVALHLGTLVAVVAYFWADVRPLHARLDQLGRARARSAPATSGSPWAIAIATVPAAIAGALGESAIEDHLGQPWQIAIFLAFFAILLWVADRRPERGRARATSAPKRAIADRRLADPRADAGRLALGDHDHDRAASRA